MDLHFFSHFKTLSCKSEKTMSNATAFQLHKFLHRSLTKKENDEIQAL